MYVKQLKVVNGDKIEGFFFTNDNSNYLHLTPMMYINSSDARNLVNSKPTTKLPPFNYYNAKTGDVIQSTNNLSGMVKKAAGVIDTKTIKNIEQYVGILNWKLLKSGIPCIAATSFFVNPQTKELMLDGEIISGLKGRKIMYAMMNRLGQLQTQSAIAGQNQAYIGVIQHHCITKNNEYEAIFNFTVSLNALRVLQREKFYFFIDVTAANNFNHKLAGIESCKPDATAKNNINSWVKQNNHITKEEVSKLGVMIGMDI